MQDTQDRVEELDNAIQTIIEASEVADHKFECRFECLEDNLQYRADRLHRSIGGLLRTQNQQIVTSNLDSNT